MALALLSSMDSVGAEVKSLAPFMEELSAEESLVMLGLALKVFDNPRRFGFLSGDEAAEAFIRYHRRLISIIKKSEALSGSKDAYIDSCLRFLAKSVQRSLRKKELVDCVLESAGETGSCFASQTASSLEPPPDTEEDERQFIGSIAPSLFLARMSAEEKRLLFLVVKCAWEMDDEMTEKVARRLGLPVLWLCSILHLARSSLEPARLYLSRVNERINAVWLRLRLIEAEIRSDTVRSEQREKLTRGASQCRERYEALLRRKARCRLLVSNRVIAEMLHIPKGSVDSGLFYLKAKQRGKLEEP
ncbi:MAG TPA: hypothetical protein VN445_06320 [Rectinemataceae bacterium]|nr:hypothetical protein [Rectinemataceae bacterium]